LRPAVKVAMSESTNSTIFKTLIRRAVARGYISADMLVTAIFGIGGTP